MLVQRQSYNRCKDWHQLVRLYCGVGVKKKQTLVNGRIYAVRSIDVQCAKVSAKTASMFRVFEINIYLCLFETRQQLYCNSNQKIQRGQLPFCVRSGIVEGWFGTVALSQWLFLPSKAVAKGFICGSYGAWPSLCTSWPLIWKWKQIRPLSLSLSLSACLSVSDSYFCFSISLCHIYLSLSVLFVFIAPLSSCFLIPHAASFIVSSPQCHCLLTHTSL